MGEIKQITGKIKKFRDERDWMQFHDSKNMAVSIILEASELLEHFQWKTTEEVEKYARQNQAEIKDEIADIALCLFEWFKNDFARLSGDVRMDADWAESMFTWANILSHRASLA